MTIKTTPRTGNTMLTTSRTLAIFSALVTLMVVIIIIPFYLFLDLPIAQAAHTLKGTFVITVGKAISNLASHNVIQTISFLALAAGVADAALNGLGKRAKSILLLALSTMTAMLIGDELKWFFGRCRPPMFFEDGSYGFTWLSGKYLQNSFPSGHTLRIFSLATAVSLLMPSKKYIPILVAILVGISRVVVGKHYPSDVMFGCFIGVICAIWSYYFLFHFNTGSGKKSETKSAVK